jgi:hypothetical protein
MNAKRLIPIPVLTVACALGAVPAWTSVASADVQQASSANWSGYVVGGSSSDSSNGSGKRFSSVSGSWVAPAAKCTGSDTYSAFWIGVGGSGGSSSADASGFGQGGSGGSDGSSSSTGSQSDSLEQAGTEADCSSNGTASYFAWYEIVPAAPVKLNLAVHAGDHIATKVQITGSNDSNMVVTMNNQTTGQSTTKTLPTNNPDMSSAEWIAEAPSQCDQSGCNPLSLTNFGTMSFAGASATTTDGHTGTISDGDWSAVAVQLNPSASSSGFGSAQFASDTTSSGGANPSSLSSDGSSFSVAYAGSGAQSTSTGSGSGYGNGSGGSSGDPYGYGGGGGDPYGDGGGSGYGYGGDPGYGYGGGDPYGDSGGGYGYGYGDGSGVIYVY